MVLKTKTIRRRGMSSFGLFVTLVLICGLAAGGYYYWQANQGAAEINENELILGQVERGSFDHIVLEQGEIDSSSNTEILCQVESRGGGGTAILWVIDEGARVEKGEKLVELDSSQLETDLKQQKIIVSNSKSSLASSEATLQQAKIAREEYLEGTYKTEEKAILSEIAVAQQNLKKAELNLGSTEKMVAKGLVNSLQMEGDQFGVVNARNQLDASEGRLEVLRNLTKQKMLVQFDSDIEAAVASREAARSTLSEEEEKLQDIDIQIKACVMYAPSAGVVVHGNKYSSRGGNAEFVVEAGAIVRERQALIRLPDPSKMQVTAKINESRITLVREGMPAKIRVESAGLELLGRVKKVNRYAEPGSWFSSSTKEYACAIEIVDPPDNIRTGMTAEVRIFVEQLTDAVQMPIQGIYEHLGKTYTLVRKPVKGFETREIVIGATNDTMATIKSGVEPGETIVLNLRSFLNLLDLPEEVEGVSEQTLLDQFAEKGIDTKIANGPTAPVTGQEGGPRGGGMPSAAEMVKRSFDEFDTDKDGLLSPKEMEAMPERSKGSLAEADTDGDGNISRSEATVAMAKVVAMIKARMSGGAGGPPGGGGFGG